MLDVGDRPAVPSTAPAAGASVPGVHQTTNHLLQVRLTWLLVFRAVVITVLLVTTVALRLGSTESAFAPAALGLYVVVGLSYATILGGVLWMRVYGTRAIRSLAFLQLAFDAGVAAVVVALTGGVDSGFVFVFSLSILNAAAVLQKQGANVLAAMVTAFYAVVLGIDLSGALTNFGVEQAAVLSEALPVFTTNAASLVLVAILAGFLSEQLKRTSESLDVARAEIDRLQQLHRAVLESLPTGVLTLDRADSVVFVNGAGADIFGTTPHILVGAPLAEISPAIVLPDDADEAVRFEQPVLLDGRKRVIGGMVAPLTGLADLGGRVLVFQDLTELRRLQAEVSRSERLAELGRFAAGLAHEIRNPLAAMIGCLQLLRADDVGSQGGDAARLLAIVHREAERLSTLVSEFLTFARPSPPTIVPARLHVLAREALDAARPGVPAGVRIDMDGDEDVVALCEPEQVRQVLWNLIGNAVQVIGQHRGAEAAGRVHVSLRRDGDTVVFAVEDDGPGVPDAIRQHIFEPFFTTRPGGTGLGLAMVHQMLMQMRGTISVEESALGGARFVVRLPAAGAQAESQAV